jgi:hypothetical protein
MTRIPLVVVAASIALVALLALASISQAAGTPQQRRACRSDAIRLCRDYIPSVARITACMQRNIRRLSPLCRAQFR